MVTSAIAIALIPGLKFQLLSHSAKNACGYLVMGIGDCYAIANSLHCTYIHVYSLTKVVERSVVTVTISVQELHPLPHVTTPPPHLPF